MPPRGLIRPIFSISLLLLSGMSALAAESKAPTKPPLMAEGTVTITEVNYFSNFNIAAYSIAAGAMMIWADRMGPLCPGTEVGTTITARYDNKLMFLGDEKDRCKLTIRRMEFTGPPQPH